jgi:HEAT repeat protein
MSPTGDGPLNSENDKPKERRRLQTGVRTLIVLVACCGVSFWALRRLWENYDPVLVEARAIQKRAIGELQSGKAAERLAAIQELDRLRFGDSTIAVGPLTRALEDPETEVRIAAADALGSIGSGVVKSRSGEAAAHAAATALIQCLKRPNTAVRVAAARALGLIGSSAVESGSGGETVGAAATALIGCLKDQAGAVRSAAAASLGKISLPRLAVVAAPRINRAAVMGALAETLGDRDDKVRLAAIGAMTSHPGTSEPPQALAQGLKDESAQNRVAAIRGLNFFRKGLDPWVSHLLWLAEHDPDSSVRIQCLTTLTFAFKPPAITAALVPALTASLKSDSAAVRSQAAALLGQFRADAQPAIPELLRVLNEPPAPGVGSKRSPFNAFDAASKAEEALGRIAPGSPEAEKVIAALIEVARNGPESRRGWAAYALGEFGPAAEEAVPVLIKVINDATPDDKFEREQPAAHALGKIAPVTRSADQAVTALLPVLKFRAPFARATAIAALGRFGPRAAAAIPTIRALKDDRNAEVRAAAAKALVAIENQSAP